MCTFMHVSTVHLCVVTMFPRLQIASFLNSVQAASLLGLDRKQLYVDFISSLTFIHSNRNGVDKDIVFAGW